jgi:hypothetical protein
MTTQRFAIGTLVGGLVLFFLGYLVFGVVFADFFAANAGTATGVPKMPFDFVSLAIGQLAWGAALTLILGWASASSVGQAARVSAIVGLLFFFGIDLTMFATTNTSTLKAAVVDPILAAVLFGMAGAAIAAVTGKKR